MEEVDLFSDQISLKSVENKVKSNAVTLDSLIANLGTIKEIPFVWNGITQGSIGYIFGPAKSGKTTLCENLAMSISAGFNEFLGYPIDKKIRGARVLFINLEEQWQTRTLRNRDQRDYIKGLDKDVNLGNYFVVNGEFPRYLITDDEWRLLENEIVNIKPEIVVIDSLSRLYQGDIEASRMGQSVSRRLDELKTNNNLTLIVIHHTRKLQNEEITMDALAGSRVFAQEADFLIGINKSPTGKNYLKEIRFRHKPEREEILEFAINKSRWIDCGQTIEENDLLSGNLISRQQNSSSERLFKIMKDLKNQSGDTIRANDMLLMVLENQIMSKATMYESINQLLKEGKIESTGKGTYRISELIIHLN